MRNAENMLHVVCSYPTVLPDEVREDALYVLDLALRFAETWSVGRELLFALCPKMELAGIRQGWIEELERIVELAQRQHDNGMIAELCFQLGLLSRLQSNFDKAKLWLTRSIDLARVTDQACLEAKTLNQLAYVAWQQHEYDKSVDFAQQALQFLGESHIERAMSLSALGLVAIDQRRWQEAEQLHRQALQIRTHTGGKRLIGWSLQNIGYALRGQGKYDEALKYFEEAIPILEDSQDLSNCAIAQMNLGIVYWQLNQPQQSLASYLKSEKIFRKIDDKLNLANNCTNIGLVNMALDNLDLAAEAFIESSELFSKIGNLSWQLNALDGLGIVFLKQKKYADAYNTFQQILTTLPNVNDPPMVEYLLRVVPAQLTEAKNKKGNAL